MAGYPALTDSLGLLSERAGDVTGLVYARLFATHPELEDLFLMDTDGGVRGSMLAQAFECLMDLAEGPGTLAETVIRSERVNHDTYDVPATEEPPTLRVGESGAVYFAVNGAHYGPAGARGAVTANLSLTPSALTERYGMADIEADQDLMRHVAELSRVAQD